MAINCRFMAIKEKGNTAVIEIRKNGKNGNPRRLTISQTQDILLEKNDYVSCVSGKVQLLIKPGTRAGAFILCRQLPPNAPWNCRTGLEINDETTKIYERGRIYTAKDIGNILRAPGATTR